MLKILSFLLLIFLIVGLVSIIPEIELAKYPSQSLKIDERNLGVYNEWTIKQIDSLSANANKDLALN